MRHPERQRLPVGPREADVRDALLARQHGARRREPIRQVDSTTESLSSANDTVIRRRRTIVSTRPSRATPFLSRYRNTFALRQYSKTA